VENSVDISFFTCFTAKIWGFYLFCFYTAQVEKICRTVYYSSYALSLHKKNTSFHLFLHRLSYIFSRVFPFLTLFYLKVQRKIKVFPYFPPGPDSDLYSFSKSVKQNFPLDKGKNRLSTFSTHTTDTTTV